MSSTPQMAEGIDFFYQQALTSEQDRLFGVVQSRLALTLDQYKIADLVRVSNELVPSRTIDHFRHFVETLHQKPTTHPLWQEIIRVITVGETYFFRDMNQWNAIRYGVLPQLIEERRAQRKRYLRLWSAGCSSGEEPYSLAIILRNMLPDIDEWQIKILATDLNISSLERAQSGHYRPWSFRSETPLEISHHWFSEVQEGFQIDPFFTSMVTFTPLNLAYDDYPSVTTDTLEMDLILCRNVLIYFGRPEATAVLRRFQRALRPDGWLVLGPAETLPPEDLGFTARNFENAILFQNRIASQPIDINIRLDGNEQEQDFSERVPNELYPEPSLPSNPYESTVPAPSNSIPVPDALERALAAANSEQWSEALNWLADAETQHQMKPEIHYLRGVIELHHAETDKALASLRRAIYCDPGFVLAHYALGELYQGEGKYRKAASLWQQAQELLQSAQPEAIVPFSDDLTVEMLSRLIQFRLDNIPAKR